VASDPQCVSFREEPAKTRDRVAFDGSVSDQTREDLESALRAVIDYAVLSQGVPPHIASEVLAQYAHDEATFVVEVARG
jgi:hypothetical protein